MHSLLRRGTRTGAVKNPVGAAMMGPVSTPPPVTSMAVSSRIWPRRFTITRSLAIVLIAFLAATGCSGDDDGAETTGARAVDGPTTITAVTIINTPFGQVLADGFGYALYTLDGDNSLCTDACLNTWPPAIADAPGPGEGVDPSLIGTVDRAEGSQLTLNARPAYRFSGDSRPGETLGCATAGRWWLVAIDGTRVTHCVP